MKLLVIDGNSIINRAFYGIKLLTTKDGRFTNGIYGFLNILIKLRDEVQPDAVAVAFDLKEPTFRHKMYDGYKAGRKGMPPELASQMPVLKELLSLLGYKYVEIPGFEADDILGTMARVCSEGTENECFLATGDRDSFQLIRDNVTVILPSTKMGRTVTTYCTPEYISENYGVKPLQMVEIKALQGDSSDNIPGVAGVGEKTADALIKEYGSIDFIYDHISELEIKEGVRQKLIKDKDNAYLSRTLGTICLEVPMDTDLSHYEVSEGDPAAAARLLSSLEMFGMIDKLGLRGRVDIFGNGDETSEKQENQGSENAKSVTPVYHKNFSEILSLLEKTHKAHFVCDYENGDFGEKKPTVKCVYFTIDANAHIIDFESAENNAVTAFDNMLSDASFKKYTDDSKHLFAYAYTKGFEVLGLELDTSLAGYILNPSANAYDPVRLLSEYGQRVRLKAPHVDSDNEQVQSVMALGVVSDYLLSFIDSDNQADLLAMEISLSEVLASMEQVGFLVDTDGLSEYGEVIGTRVSEMTRRIYDECGFEFNLNSPKQLGEALFEKLGLPAKKKTKSGYSTSADVLESLAEEYPIVADILEYRTVQKLKSTYCDGLKACVAKDGRIHSTLNQTETRTGRISSTDPNLQNIPVRKPLGSELRKFFVAKPGYALVDADYSQIELRVLAHMADDKNMISAFETGEDIHRITASQVFGVPLSEVTHTMRNNAKAVNFGIVYGIGAHSLGKNIGVPYKDADAYIKGYLHNFSGVDAYMKNVVEEAKANGYVKTLYERRRYLPELTSSNHMLRAFGERVARNMPIQGTAADIIKIAMIKVYNRLKAEKLDARLIMQVHDELIVETREDIADSVCEIVKEEMENACALKVRLLCDAHVGKTWYEAKG